MKPTHYLKFGAEMPYDANDDGEAAPSSDWAHAAARGVLADLEDRRGIAHGLDSVDLDVRLEIVEAIAAIIRAAPDWFRKQGQL